MSRDVARLVKPDKISPLTTLSQQPAKTEITGSMRRLHAGDHLYRARRRMFSTSLVVISMHSGRICMKDRFIGRCSNV